MSSNDKFRIEMNIGFGLLILCVPPRSPLRPRPLRPHFTRVVVSFLLLWNHLLEKSEIHKGD